MFDIYRPSYTRILDIQESEGSYYWSGTAASLFRSFGYIALKTIEVSSDELLSPDNGRTQIILRSCEPPKDVFGGQSRIWETPTKTIIDGFFEGSAVSKEIIPEATLLDAEKKVIGKLFRQLVRVKDRDQKIVRLNTDQGLWHTGSMNVQVWPDSYGIVLAWLALEDGRQVPAVIKIGQDLIFTFPVFDILGEWFGFPPLDERYAGIEGGFAPTTCFDFLSKLIEEHHLGCASEVIVKARPFPAPYKNGMTIRHDYDRPISDESWFELLRFYETKGIRASFGFLGYLQPPHIIEVVENHGHEVNFHCYAHTEYELRQQLSSLTELTQQGVDGVTIHGGPSGMGFRGETHYWFFEHSKFLYSECYGVRNVHYSPLARIVDNVPVTSEQQIAPPYHYSLDVSTRLGEHKLESLKKELPLALRSENYVVLMNHPDIHREALYELINGLDLSLTWTPTLREAMEFYYATRQKAIMITRDNQLIVSLGKIISNPATFEVIRPGKVPEIKQISVPAGSQHTSIPK